MPRHRILFAVLVAIVLISMSSLLSVRSSVAEGNVTPSWPGGLVIDHACINQEMIPIEWIDAAQDNVIIHYAHTSHGGQITAGLSLLESANATFDVSIGYLTLPTDEGALCILDGNPPESYITPDLYWQGVSALELTQGTIDANPSLTVSLWSWCTQVDSYSEEQVQEYLDAMSSLEDDNPNVTFIYMTGNAQAGGSSGYNRWLRNEQIRQYCIANEKILFDFADLDCWSNGNHSTYDYTVGEDTIHIPIEHEDFNGDEAAHTTYTSCEQKGRAFWWMVAMLAGWNAPDITTTTTATTTTSTTTTTTTTTSKTTTTSSSTTTTGTELTTDQLFLDDVVVFVAVAGVVLLVLYAGVRKYYG